MEKQINDIYRTIASESKGLYKDRGSKFMAFAFPVINEDEVKLHVQQLKKKYHDAKHYCYGYRLGTENQQYRVNDDGEPSGTAGKPIYGQILSYELTNILIVVVRYFGGTLLGTSGLIHAYREAAKNCLNNATIIKLTVQDELTLRFSYEVMNSIMRVIKEEDAVIIEQHFESDYSLKLNVRKSQRSRLIDRVSKLKHVTIIEK
jgi:uncharacterized YigZ family protein